MNPLTNFNVKAFCDAANELVRADEVERALNLLNNMPAWYRDFEPAEITSLRNEILAKLATPWDYKNNDTDHEIANVELMRGTLRYELIKADVQDLNDKGHIPHIIDYAPGEFWLPILLKKDGLSFTYDPIYLCDEAFEKTKHLYGELIKKDKSKSSRTIYVACEIIEQLANENEIKIEMLKHYGECDIVHVSTPKYSFDYQCMDWRERKLLGHLRAYTPKEFFDKVEGMFSKYKFTCFDSQILHARGVIS